MEYKFILDNLNCAHCASKIEDKIKSDSRFCGVAFNFATKQLMLNSDINDVLIEIQSIVDSIEDGVTVKTEAVNNPHKRFDADRILLVISSIICILLFVLHIIGVDNFALFTLSILTTLVAGYKVFLKGIKSLLKLRLDETTLLTIAVVAAIILGEYFEACAVTVLFSIGEWLEDIAVNKSRRDIEKLSNIKEDYAYIEDENGTLTQVLAQDINIGTEIIIKPFARVPLDSVVISGKSYVDTSALTGESVPLSATDGTQLLSGMINGENILKVRTTKAYTDSTANRIIKLVEESVKDKGKADKLISRFARVYTPAVIILSILIAVVPSLITGEFETWIYRALVCLVSSCPCAIVISVPLAYYAGIGASSKKGVLIKGGKYIETLANATVFAFDKTGTLTSGKMTVTDVIAFENYDKYYVLSLAASAEKMSSHPIARAIVEYAKKSDAELIQLTDYTEKQGYGVSAKMGESTIICGGFDSAYKGIVVSLDNKRVGVIKVSDTIRPESKSVIDKLRKSGVTQFMMLTGDNEENTKRVANVLDIKYKSGLLPEDKLQIVKKHTKDNICVFVGDGINDAPVMAVSDCAVAMGLSSEVAIESADMVLVSDSLTQLPTAMKIARKTMRTVKTNIILSLAVKAIVIALATIGIAPMWLAVFADTGVSVLCVLNSTRLLK